MEKYNQTRRIRHKRKHRLRSLSCHKHNTNQTNWEKQTGGGRNKYTKCNDEQQETLNNTMQETQNTITQPTEDNTQHTKEWLSQGATNLPKEQPKDRYRRHKMSERTLSLIKQR